MRWPGRWLLAAGGVAAAAVTLASPSAGGPVARPAPATTSLPCGRDTVPVLADRLPFGPGERLSYVATLNGLRAATADIEVQERATVDGKLSYPVAVKAQSNAVVSLWARMDAQLVTQLDPDRVLPWSMKSLTRGDKMDYQEDIRFPHGTTAVAASTRLNGKRAEQQLPVTGDALDVLGLVYYARSRDVAPGRRFCMELYQGRLLWRIRGTVSGPETVQTDAGPFEAWAARGEAVALLAGGRGPALLKQPRPFQTWMTADQDRIPLLLQAPTPYGEIVVKLTRFEQGRRLARARR
ncbi:MAG: DUF3108 domain-containing protein [Deltaproteobacteria bacterium]|nr:DUF3108 domain-containing protein [Deltaproteobacteria bacterium]